MRVLYWQPYLHTNGADHWIYLGWKHGFEDAGHDFFELTAADRDWKRTIDRLRPDILFCQNLVDLQEHTRDLLWAREYGVRVFLVVHWPIPAADVSIIRDYDVADVYFGERAPESMAAFIHNTGRPYELLPNAADSRLHYPAPFNPKYDYDIVYLGACLPTKRAFFDQVLGPLAKRYRVGVFGPGWTLRDRALGSLGRAARRLALQPLADAASRARVTVPVEEERSLYSSARISLNFHERVPGHVIVNQRTFKIAACGGFQIMDYVPEARRYFSPDELVMAEDREEWFDKIEHFLARPEARAINSQLASRRALRDHTYVNRVELVLSVDTRRAGLRVHRHEATGYEFGARGNDAVAD